VTTTTSTSTACYATAGITAVCSRRKKRSLERWIEESMIKNGKEREMDLIRPSAVQSGQQASYKYETYLALED